MRSEERYQYLVQNSPDIIYILDTDGRFTFTNITVQRVLGFSPDQLQDKPFAFIVHEDDVARSTCRIRAPQGQRTEPVHMQLKFRLNESTDHFKLFEIEHTPIELTPPEA